jgi:hypothetical protein
MGQVGDGVLVSRALPVASERLLTTTLHSWKASFLTLSTVVMRCGIFNVIKRLKIFCTVVKMDGIASPLILVYHNGDFIFDNALYDAFYDRIGNDRACPRTQ